MGTETTDQGLDVMWMVEMDAFSGDGCWAAANFPPPKSNSESPGREGGFLQGAGKRTADKGEEGGAGGFPRIPEKWEGDCEALHLPTGITPPVNLRSAGCRDCALLVL